MTSVKFNDFLSEQIKKKDKNGQLLERRQSSSQAYIIRSGALEDYQRIPHVLCFLFAFLGFGGSSTNFIDVSNTPFTFCNFQQQNFNLWFLEPTWNNALQCLKYVIRNTFGCQLIPFHYFFLYLLFCIGCFAQNNDLIPCFILLMK